MNHKIYFSRHLSAILGFSFLFVLVLMVFGFIPWVVRQVFTPDANTYFYLVLGVAGTLLSAILAFVFLGTKPKLAFEIRPEGVVDYTLDPKGYLVPWSAIGDLSSREENQKTVLCLGVHDLGAIDTSAFFHQQRQGYEARIAQYGTPLVFFPAQYQVKEEVLRQQLTSRGRGGSGEAAR